MGLILCSTEYFVPPRPESEWLGVQLEAAASSSPRRPSHPSVLGPLIRLKPATPCSTAYSFKLTQAKGALPVH